MKRPLVILSMTAGVAAVTVAHAYGPLLGVVAHVIFVAALYDYFCRHPLRLLRRHRRQTRMTPQDWQRLKTLA